MSALTEYTVQSKFKLRNRKESVCFSDTFDALGAAEEHALDLLEQGDRILGIFAVDSFNGDMTRIENGARLTNQYQSRQHEKDTEEGRIERDEHLYGSESDGSAFGVSSHWFI